MNVRIINQSCLTGDLATNKKNDLMDLEKLVDSQKVQSFKLPDFPSAHKNLSMQGQTLPPDFYNWIKDLAEAGQLPDSQYLLDLTEPQLGVDLVFKKLYRTISNSEFPETIPIKDFMMSDFFFAQHMDGEAVYMNDFKGGKGQVATLQINAGGWNVSFRDKLFRKEYKSQLARQRAAIGYRHFLNSVYMRPFVEFTGTNGTSAFTQANIKSAIKADMTWFEKNWMLLKTAIDAFNKMCIKNKWYGVKPTLVMNTVTESWFMDVADAVNPDGNKRYPALTAALGNRVVYDGASLLDEDKKVTYSGIADGVILLVAAAGDRYIELEKLPLTLIADEGLANNLGMDTNVLYDCRSMIANTEAIIKITCIPLYGTDSNSPMGAST